MESITVFTDGGCSGNPGPGGWAYVIEHNGGREKASGSDRTTTNNRMELTAVIEALKKILALRFLSNRNVSIYTDSVYVKSGITEWIDRWVRNGWKTASKKNVKNRELWMELLELTTQVNLSWNWVQGHSGNRLNEMCDAMVQNEIRRLKTR